MNWPSGVQWEWAIGEFAVLGFLFWELYRLRRTQRRDREKAREPRSDQVAARRSGVSAASGCLQVVVTVGDDWIPAFAGFGVRSRRRVWV